MTLSLLAGCGTNSSNRPATDHDSKIANTENTEEAAEAASTDGGKTLVVYYSATGNTKDIAEKIAKITGGDLFEIEPVEPYTNDDLDWTKDDSRVSKEHDDESLRDVALVSTTVDDWDSYENVYIGYPIWWGIAAWPVDNFVVTFFQNQRHCLPEQKQAA